MVIGILLLLCKVERRRSFCCTERSVTGRLSSFFLILLLRLKVVILQHDWRRWGGL